MTKKALKKMLRNAEDLKNLTDEQLENQIFIFRHRYFIVWLLHPITAIKIFALQAILSLVGMLMFHLSQTLSISILSTIVQICLPFMYVFTIFFCVIYFLNSKYIKQGNIEKHSSLVNRLSLVTLLNFRVINSRLLKHSRKIKMPAHHFFTEDTLNKCYSTIFYLAVIMQDPEIKLAWISAEDYPNSHKFGHAVLVKGNYVYDSNQRRTYNLEKYMKAYNAEIYKMFSINEYCLKDFIGKNFSQTKKIFHNLHWDEFGEWCKQRGVVRCIQDEE